MYQTSPRGDYARATALAHAARRTRERDPLRQIPGRLTLLTASEFGRMSLKDRSALTNRPFVIKAEKNLFYPEQEGSKDAAQNFLDGMNTATRADRVCTEILFDDLGRVPPVKVQIIGKCSLSPEISASQCTQIPADAPSITMGTRNKCRNLVCSNEQKVVKNLKCTFAGL
jgi:hypothetical protein